MKHHAFLACHPAVNLLYFVLVLTFSMFFLHPLCIAVSLCAALWCAAQLNGGAAVRRTVSRGRRTVPATRSRKEGHRPRSPSTVDVSRLRRTGAAVWA